MKSPLINILHSLEITLKNPSHCNNIEGTGDAKST